MYLILEVLMLKCSIKLLSQPILLQNEERVKSGYFQRGGGQPFHILHAALRLLFLVFLPYFPLVLLVLFLKVSIFLHYSLQVSGIPLYSHFQPVVFFGILLFLLHVSHLSLADPALPFLSWPEWTSDVCFSLC